VIGAVGVLAGMAAIGWVVMQQGGSPVDPDTTVEVSAAAEDAGTRVDPSLSADAGNSDSLPVAVVDGTDPVATHTGDPPVTPEDPTNGQNGGDPEDPDNAGNGDPVGPDTASQELVTNRLTASPGSARWLIDGESCDNPCTVKKRRGAKIVARAVRDGFSSSTVRFTARDDFKRSVRPKPLKF
jgi:hypothetical protein